MGNVLNTIVCGDALDILKKRKSNIFDAVILDPPSSIFFMSKKWDSDKGGRQQWVAWLTEILQEVYRTTKPGGHMLVWAIPRRSHWTALAIEDADGMEEIDAYECAQGETITVTCYEYKSCVLSPLSEPLFLLDRFSGVFRYQITIPR